MVFKEIAALVRMIWEWNMGCMLDRSIDRSEYYEPWL